MHIAIDLRSLQSGTISGVENYTLNLLENLLAMDKNNTYTLFYNGFKKLDLADFQYVNVKAVKTSVPNKLLNLGLKLNILSFENFIGHFDVLFMPNLNVVNLNTKAKIAITVHDLSPMVAPEFYDIKRRLWHKFLNIKKLLTRADLIFAVSNYTKQDILRLYNLAEEKIKVIYPGVDILRFNANIPIDTLRALRNQYGLPKDFFLFLNTIEPRKNLSGLVRAFENSNLNSHLVVAGKRGWKTSEIFKLLKKSAKTGRIHYIGYIKEEDKPGLIKMANAVLYPSVYEGFGFQVLEAMAIGVPVVVSQVASLPEVAGDAALLINPQNSRDLIKAMIEMEKNIPLRNMLIAKGFERVKRFNWELTARQTLGGLESICA